MRVHGLRVLQAMTFLGKGEFATAHRTAVAGLKRKLFGASSPACGADAADATLLLLQCALELWYTQRLLLGPLHPECAQVRHHTLR